MNRHALTTIFALLFFIGIFCWPEQATAQIYLSTPDTALYHLDTLKVTATRYQRSAQRIPYALSVLDDAELRRLKKGLSIEEVLRTVPGLQVNNRYNLSQGDRIAIRGLGSRASFGVRGIKVMLDGIPLTMPDGQTQLNNIDLASIGRVEILRGPSSSLYGNASGGVILIDSRMPPEKLQVSQQLALGSDGYRKSTSSMAGRLERTSYSLHYTALHSDGFRDHSQAHHHIVNVLAKRRFSPAVELSTVFSYVNAPYMLNASSLSKRDAMENPRFVRGFVKDQGSGKKVEQAQGGLSAKIKSSFGDFHTTVYGVGRSLYNAIPGRLIQLDRLAGGLRTTFTRHMSPFGLDAVLLLGSDLERQQDSRIEHENNGISGTYKDVPPEKILDRVQAGDLLLNQDESVLNTSVFAELNVAPRQKWSVSSGLRADFYKFVADDLLSIDGKSYSGTRKMHHISPMLGLSYQPSREVNLYSLYSTAFQTPTTTELSNQPTEAGGFNPLLEAEKIANLELGVKGLLPAKRLQFSAALYSMAISDMLIPYQINSATSEEIYYRNAGRARNNGFETAVSYHPSHWFFASLAYTFSDFRYSDYIVETNDAEGQGTRQLGGNRLPGVPRHAVNLGFNVRRPAGFTIGLNLSASDAFYANDFNGPIHPGDSDEAFINDAYVVADLSLEYTFPILQHQLNFYALVDNLFDVRHNRSIVPNAFGERFFEPAAGRCFFLGMKVDISKK